MKYKEKEILDNVLEYIVTTYSQHYNSKDNIQVNDLIMAIGHGEGSYVANAIEYLARYGKKDGKNVKDLYKAIHNIIFLIYLNHEKDEVIDDSDNLKERIDSSIQNVRLVNTDNSKFGSDFGTNYLGTDDFNFIQMGTPILDSPDLRGFTNKSKKSIDDYWHDKKKKKKE
jgi:hypothetical protein